MSNISHLAARLKSQIQEEQQALESQTSELLARHGDSLKQLSADALNTTKSAIKSESDLLLKSITSFRTQAESHVSKLPSMLWIAMLWPMLLTIGLCVLVVLLTWIWLPTSLFQAQTVNREMSNGKTYTVIVSPGWATCELDKRAMPCAPKQ